MGRFFFLAVCLFVLIGSGCERQDPVTGETTIADHVFLHGGVYTVDHNQPWVEAVAVRDGEIIYVGSDAGAERLVGTNTAVTDLSGRLLLPGFHDSHIHLAESDGNYEGCGLLGIYSVEAMHQKFAACAELPGRGDAGWIVGGGWDRAILFGGINPDKAMLDEHFPDRPVYFNSSDGHSSWVNSKALELAGIDRNTPDEPRRKIDRDPATGEPTGILDELSMDLVTRVIPPLTSEQRLDMLLGDIATAHRFGITSILEPGADAALLDPYVELDRDGRLELRVRAALSPLSWIPGAFGPEVHDLIASRDKFRGTHLRPDWVKIYADGVLENGTGALLDPYIGSGEKYGHGHPHYSQEDLNNYVTRFDAEGIRIAIHAIGDLGTRMALNAFEAAREANGKTGNRHHIVHLQMIHPDDIARFGELDVAAVFQALWALPDEWIMDLNLPWVGPERVNRMYPIASVQRAGGRIVGGSDWFVSSMNPLDAIEVAIRRQDWETADGPVLNADERVDLATMLEAYTINGAWVMDQEDRVGSIEVSKRADLIVIDRNLFEIPATEINEAQVVMTLFDGKPVYEADVL